MSLTSCASDVGAEPAVGVVAGGGPGKVNGAAQILQPAKLAGGVRRVQDVCGLQPAAFAVGVQHDELHLHALAPRAPVHGLVEAVELKATLAVRQHAARHPAPGSFPLLLSCHGGVVEHVVDGAEERRNLMMGTEFQLMRMESETHNP